MRGGALVESLLRESRGELVVSLDEALLGVRPRPTGLHAVASLAR